jgi:hypothetical protein
LTTFVLESLKSTFPFSVFIFRFGFSGFLWLRILFLGNRCLSIGLVSLGMDYCHFVGTTLLTATRLLTSSTHLLPRICEWHVKLKRLLLSFLARDSRMLIPGRGGKSFLAGRSCQRAASRTVFGRVALIHRHEPFAGGHHSLGDRCNVLLCHDPNTPRESALTKVKCIHDLLSFVQPPNKSGEAAPIISPSLVETPTRSG